MSHAKSYRSHIEKHTLIVYHLQSLLPKTESNAQNGLRFDYPFEPKKRNPKIRLGRDGIKSQDFFTAKTPRSRSEILLDWARVIYNRDWAEKRCGGWFYENSMLVIFSLADRAGLPCR
jgi:hypothetical protein